MEAPLNRAPSSSVAPSDQNLVFDNGKSAALKKFASFLGTKGNKDSVTSPQIKDIPSLLSSHCQDDDVVLTVPSLDLRLAESEKVLPEVGEHSGTTSRPVGEDPRLNMAASVLTHASDGKAIIEQKAVQNIGKQTSWTRSTVSYATAAVGSNLSNSFTTLLNSRVRAWTLLLLRHSLSTGDSESRSRLLSMLSAKIQVKLVETTFKALSLPESAAGAKPKDADAVLPLLFEVVLHITIQDKPESVELRAPGTISGVFAGDKASDGLKLVHVRLDTGILLSSMVDQARIVVLKAVASATDTPVLACEALNNSSKKAAEEEAKEPAASDNRNTLGSFRSAVTLTHAAADQSAQLQKARTSALRLNRVLHGKSATKGSSSLGPRKVRSVKWDQQLGQAPKLTPALTPSPKKLRMIQTAAKLKSYKSFGRPHAGDFGSGPCNATFGEYGRPTAGVWGRDGRLAAHPVPMQTAGVDQMGNSVSAEKNATFDNLFVKKPPTGTFNSLLRASHEQQQSGTRSAAASAGAALLGRTTTSSPSMSSSMPRNATALETSLMQKWR